ncbi:ATP-dependent zinc metalloprotease FtsH [Patescibacteria group bacterium]|nr:ATP-dependent zinc metalloprotease FtsH [Patescibacteria group bacterium]MBU1906888.1 ATP-dependent zinc metalloprotease FtsH [Patescibacteria group bacterium]
MKPLSKNILLFVLTLLVIGAIFSTYNLSTDKPEEIGVGTLVEWIHAGEVERIAVKGDEVNITKTDATVAVTRKEGGEALSDLLTNYGVEPAELAGIAIDIEGTSGRSYFLGIILPSLLPLLLLVVIFYFLIRQMQGANVKAMQFGQSGAREFGKDAKGKVTFDDVAGVKEAKEELMEVVEFLRNPKKFVDVGAKIPKGVLLMGSPGTGKTLLGRAVAGQANVPFYHISGSEFVEMFVGVGASRVRDLFAQAKKNAPCIVFIDEIDAVGRQRGTGLGGSHDEREQTLNQILVEMDGFDPHLGVIVLAATNRPDVLDPALLRPGRFDRRVILDLPDIDGREEILKIHAKNKPLEKVDLRQVAERTPGFSGADLENLLNEAAILTARRDKKKIGMSEVLESVDKVLLGPERKSHILSKKEKEITAIHEAGHALITHLLPNSDPVHKVSIISRGQAAGYTLKLPIEDRKLHSRSEFIDELAVMLGGHVAEKEAFNDVTTGACNDLQKATRLARDLVTQYGMSEKLGPRTYGEREEMVFLGREITEQRNYSDATAELIDKEISSLIDDAMKTALKVIREHKTELDKIVKMLLEKETIERDEFEALLGKNVTRED